MLSNIKMMIGAGLLVLALCTSYLSYNFYGQIKVLELRHETTLLQLKEKDSQLSKLQESCKINSEISTELAKESQVMGDKLVDLMDELNKLDKKQKVLINETPRPQAIQPILVGGGADADLQRVLDAAFCAADPDNSYCASNRVGAGASN